MYAKNAVPQHDGDAYLHAGPTASEKSRNAPPARVDFIEIEREAQRLREHRSVPTQVPCGIPRSPISLRQKPSGQSILAMAA